MKISVIMLLTSIVSLLLGAVAVQEMQFQAHTHRLQMLQQQATLIARRCQSNLHGSAAILCDNIGTEALYDLEEVPGSDILKVFDACQFAVLRAYENHHLSEAEKNAALDQIQAETMRKLNAAEASPHYSWLELLHQ